MSKLFRKMTPTPSTPLLQCDAGDNQLFGGSRIDQLQSNDNLSWLKWRKAA